ncbi:MAG: helix-turn-helix domain-containing protein [Pseudomonadota bacterium]
MDRKKLETLLCSRGTSLNQLAKKCGISRQSLYNMFEGKSVLTKPFEKLLSVLGVDFDDIVTGQTQLEDIFSSAPDKVRKAALALLEYAQNKDADLFLIGSRAKGKKGVRPDWDFAIYFPDLKMHLDLASLKQRVSDIAFPHRIDIVDFTSAPDWFKRSIADDAIRMSGATTRDKIFSRRVA